MLNRRAVLGAVLAAPAISLLPTSAEANPNIFSSGWRMGSLDKFSVTGLFNKTGEGQLLLGSESSPVRRTVGTGKDAKEIIDNPWYFSSDKEMAEQFRALMGEYVAIRYNEYHVTGPLSGETNYRVQEIRKVDPSVAPQQAVVREGGSGLRSDGDRVGRIVKATRKGNVLKSYEVTMQVGNGGSQFVDMSVSDEAMFTAVEAFLRSGRRVKVTYTTSLMRNPLTASTNSDILGISLSASGLTQ